MSCGLATYSFQPLTASLLLADTPVGYTPARGPALPFTLVCTHRDQLQPQIFTYSNLGRETRSGLRPAACDRRHEGMGGPDDLATRAVACCPWFQPGS